MHQTLMLTHVLSVALVTACAEKDQPEQTREIVRPVKTLVIESSEAGGQHGLPGRVEAANRATQTFQVAGKLKQILVKEGQNVTVGQTLARLGPKDFQIVVNDRTATFHRTEADFKRGKGLVRKAPCSMRCPAVFC